MACAFFAHPSSAAAQTSAPAEGEAGVAAKPTIVLVHGAFADGTGWQHVIRILERDGYNVIAVPNPLASLAGDVETSQRVIDAQKGPVAMGHSHGGAVITGSAVGSAPGRWSCILIQRCRRAIPPRNSFA